MFLLKVFMIIFILYLNEIIIIDWTSNIPVETTLEKISDERINELFEEDLAVCTTELDKHLPFWKNLNDVRQRCLIDLTFNLGMPRLRKFVKTLDHIKNNRFEEASIELLDSRYAKQVGKRAERIAEMLRTGEDSQEF